MWDLLPRNSISSIQCQLFHLNFCGCCCSVLFSYRAKRLPTVLATTMVNSIQSPHQTQTLSRQWNKKKKKRYINGPSSKRSFLFVLTYVPIRFRKDSRAIYLSLSHMHRSRVDSITQHKAHSCGHKWKVRAWQETVNFTLPQPNRHDVCNYIVDAGVVTFFFSFFLSIPSRVYLHVFGLCSGVLFALQVNPSVGLGLLCLCSFV